MKTELLILNEERNVTLTAYLQPAGGEFKGITARPAVLILPGGGYQFCSDREADPVAFPYLKAGYHAFILRYSLKELASWPNPLDDFEQAMALIRGRADEWHVAADRIAVIGFSAGGHLAACAATMSKNRPNAAILGYPVTIESAVQAVLPSAPDPASAVDAKTCPCFVFATRTDNLVPVENSLRFLVALERGEIAFESHIYANGPHGLSTGDGSVTADRFSVRYPNWVGDSITWLEEVLGGFGDKGLTAPRFGARLNGNREKTLNLDCTLQHLLENDEACRRLPFLNSIVTNTPILSGALRTMPLRDCLTYGGFDEDKLRAIEAELRSIPNS